jgi:metal-responsive CopG/Arc/MetJ family transcriptional regulator
MGGNTGYTHAMAKVMISLPDELLAQVDARASERGSTRSATIRELAEAAFGQRADQLAQRMNELDGRATSHGGDVVSKLKAGRPA